MVSLDISVGNPTWPNLDVLSYVRARVCSSLQREHIGAKETTAASVYSAAGTYLRSRGRGEANNTSYVHATVPPHPLSSNVSFFPYGYRTWLTWRMEKTEGTREGIERASGTTLTKVREERRRNEPSRRRRRLTIGERERERNTYETRILIITVIP